MAPTWLKAFREASGCTTPTDHPPLPSSHIKPSTQHIKARHAGFNGCLPCTTNFKRGDFAATTVAKTASKMREFMFEPGAPRKACLPQPPLPHSRWSFPEMLRPRLCCWSRSAHRACAPPPPRVCAARLEESGRQAPPRKQKARGSVDVAQGRDGQQWGCSHSLRKAAELTEGGWCARARHTCC